MPTTVVAPATHAQTETDLGHAYVYAEQRLDAALTEQLDVFGAGLVVGVGDLSGTGSDTVRVGNYSGIGSGETFQPLGETEVMTATGFAVSNDTLTIGRYGLAKEQSYQDAMLQTPAAREIFALDRLVQLVPASWLATLRDLWATQIGTFSNVIGDSGLPWTYDDELELVAYFRETEGYDPMVHGKPVTGRAPEQLTQLRNSLRNEPGLQGSADLMQKLMDLGTAAGGGFDFLGLRNIGSHAVGTSGGDHIGGAYIPGAVAYITASTAPVPVQDPARSIILPQFGIVIEGRSNPDGAHARFSANAWLGMGNRAATVFPQTRIRSVNA